MDEQECIFEIVDGVLTIVPKEKSVHEQPNAYQRSSSIASSSSTPSLSEPERDESSSPLLLLKPLSPPPQTDQSADILDLFSAPLTSINPITKNSKTLLDDSLSSVSSYGEHSIENKKQATTSIPRSSSPINHSTKSSSIKGRRREKKKNSFYKYL